MAGPDRTWLPLGSACVLIGVAAIAIAARYPYGTVTAMGPGFVPTAVAGLLTLFGVVILLRRGRDVAAAEAEGTPAFAPEGPLRALVCIAGAIVVFGLAIRPLGLPIAVFASSLIASAAHPEARWKGAVALAAFLAVASSLVFVLLLGLSIGLAPKFE